MKKKLLAILLTVCMVLSMAPAALAAGSVFTDVKADDWFADEVKYVYDNGLMNGVGDNAFDPSGTVTRAMVWTTLARLDGVNTAGSDPWWLDGQQWAMENEISDGTMAENNITREQLVTMIWRYAKYIDMDVSEGEDTNILSYTDALNVNEWAFSAMQWACAVGIINGIDGALQPQGNATRAQLAAILYRFVEEVANAAPAAYTVTFMWNYGDKGIYETVEVEDGKTVGSLRNPSRSGYTFFGWYTEDGDRFTLNTKVTADIVVYAKWSKDVYIPSHTHSWTAGTPVPPTCSSEGYIPYTCSCGSSKNDDFVSAVEHVAGEKCEFCGVTEVETAEQLLAAAQGEGEVKIKMIANITIDIAAWQNNALGGEGTTSVIIDGENGDVDYTLTFNQTNSDWNNVVTNNEATLVLKNMNITNSGHNNGPWNRHDINFGCNVEMENVNSDKALAFKAGATLTNVTIADANTSDTYAIWIQPNGQTVTLDGCTIDMLAATDGRGIKIDEQYVDAPAKVTLTVSNTTFKTDEKGAILVKSKAGADITLSDVDINGVTADAFNEVWVDEDSASYYDLVTVTGGSKILEGTSFVVVKTADDLISAFADLKANDVIYIAANIDMTGQTIKPVKGNVGFTMRGNGNTISNLSTTAAALFVDHSGSSAYTFEDVVLEGCSVNSATNYGALFVGDGDTSDAITITNCHVKNCSVNSKKYAAAFVAYTAGYNVQNNGPVYSDVTIKDCSVTGGSITGQGSVGAAVAHAGGNDDTTTTITNFTVNGAVITGEDAEHTGVVVGTANVGDTVINNAKYENVTGNYNGLYGRFVPGTTGNLVIDGKIPVAEGLAIDPETGAYEISNADGLFNFAKQVNEENNDFSGKTVKLTSNIDLENAVWTPIGQTGATEFKGVFDGQNHTIKNLNVDNSAATDEHTSSGLFGWAESNVTIQNVNIDGATVKGNHNVAVIVGYTYSGKITNCHVSNANVVCTHANNDACGDKAGLIAGYAADESRITDCSGSDSTVVGGRDAGQLIGCGYNVSLSNCSATNVTVTAGSGCTGANIRAELIGRVMS